MNTETAISLIHKGKNAYNFMVKWYPNIKDALLSVGAPNVCLEDLESLNITEEQSDKYWDD
jgi:hypothetical protein